MIFRLNYVHKNKYLWVHATIYELFYNKIIGYFIN